MPKCQIDGIEVEFQPGENLVEIAKRVDIEIPVFCYHPELTVVAQCRMCTVEIEGMPKLQTGCSTSPREGAVIHTQSAKVLKNRESVMEFLLVNHPLDCPICDKAGECDLQDFSFEHGSAYMRSSEDRRTYLDLDMGPVIQKNMNRCIHCTRCIRFGDEVAKIREMVAIQRGNNVEITTVDGKALETDYAGNYADICPTGSLTLKDFRFNKRAWMLKKTPTICEGCSKGCNMEIHWDADTIHRCLPRENKEINRHWLCDEGRFNFRYVAHPSRITKPSLLNNEKQEESTWEDALKLAKDLTKNKKTLILAGTDLTLEELELLKRFSSETLSGSEIYHFGTKSVLNTKDDGPLDHLLKMKSKTSNLNGAEKLSLQPYTDGLKSKFDVALVFKGGRAELPDLSGIDSVGVGVFNSESDSLKGFKAILPGHSFAEKTGTVVNHQNKEQQINRAIVPPKSTKALSEFVMVWTHSHASAGVA